MTSPPSRGRASSSSAAASSGAAPPITWRKLGWQGRRAARARTSSPAARPGMRPAWSASCAPRPTSRSSQVQRRAVRQAGAGDRPGDRLEAQRRPAPGLQRRSGWSRSSARRPPPTASDWRCICCRRPRRRQLWPVMDDRRCRRGRVPAHRRPGQSFRHRAGARQGRAHAGRAGSSRIARSPAIQLDRRPRIGVGTAHGDDRGRDRRQLRRPVGARRSGGSPASACRCSPVQHQYLVTEPIAGVPTQPADAARSRPADLFQGRGRRPGHGRL